MGAPGDGDGGGFSGALYVVSTGRAVLEAEKLVANDASSVDEFGAELALDGETLLVGAPRDDDAGGDSGSVYVFARTAEGFVESQKLTASDGAAGDAFGSAVAVAGDVALIGAPADDEAGSNCGSVYVFERGPGGFVETAKLGALDAASGDRFGAEVALSNAGTAFVAAPMREGAGSDAGAIYVFEATPAGFVQTGELAGVDASAGDEFGGALALLGDMALVGAPGDDDGGTNSGSAYAVSLSGAECPTLFGAPRTIALESGGTQSFRLNAGADRAGLLYLLLGSASGTSPGIPVDGLVLPLNFDALLAFDLANPNSAIFPGSLGLLDAAGRATAARSVPPGQPASLAVSAVHHAYVVLDVAAGSVVFASDPAPLSLVP